MKKVIFNFIAVAYFIVAIILTVCLLSYNEYKVTEIGDYVFVLSTDEELEDISKKGDLIIVKKESNKNINVGDKVFFYTKENGAVIICAADVTLKEQAYGRGYTYAVEGDYRLSDKHIIGKVDSSTKIPYLGTVLSILESRLVFLFLIVLPTFIIFLYEGYQLIIEMKYGAFENME